MLHFFTFCVDIGKHNRNDLVKILKLLIDSLNKTNFFELIIFTNFPIDINQPNIIIKEYFYNNINIYEENKWLNLSFNKINIYKYLYNKFNIDFIWVDLDTIFTHDVSYINDLSSCFIDCGGINQDPHKLIEIGNFYIARNKGIQGNFWKLNIDLYHKLIEINRKVLSKKTKFLYDLQSLFTFYFYFILGGLENTLLDNNIYILGRNIKHNLISGLSIWHPDGNKHPTLLGLNNLYYKDNKLKSEFYPNQEIHMLSFTFDTIKKLYNTDKFKELFSK